MKPFELKEALEQGYAYTRDKKKIVDLKISNCLDVTYRVTGRIENDREMVRSWTCNGECYVDNSSHSLDLCYLELETIIVISHNDNFYTRSIDLDQLSDLINFNTDLLKIGELKITIPQQK
jgi:hypothetical protein